MHFKAQKGRVEVWEHPLHRQQKAQERGTREEEVSCAPGTKNLRLAPHPHKVSNVNYIKNTGKLISLKKIIISGILKVISAAFKTALFWNDEVFWKRSPIGGGYLLGHSSAGR